MALFGAPIPQVDHALRAVRAGLAMQERHQQMMRSWQKRGLPAPPIGIGIVTGVGKFTQHMIGEQMVFMKLLGRTHPHAKVVKVDTSKAEKLPGVVAIMHRGNMPKEYQDVAMEAGPPTRFMFGEEVYQVGAPVAAVAAESEHIADEALRMIEVEYQVLPAVFDYIEATRPHPSNGINKLAATLAVAQPFVAATRSG
jgi:CO/xanthine dehydrogenase Mo-binding subunit